MAARNMYRIEINIHETLYVKLVIYKVAKECFVGKSYEELRHFYLTFFNILLASFFLLRFACLYGFISLCVNLFSFM